MERAGPARSGARWIGYRLRWRIRRESYFNRFANAFEGIDLDTPGIVPSRNGKPTEVPRVVGPISRSRPVQVRDVEFLRRHTDRPIKITIPGAFTMAKLAFDEY